MNELKDYIVVLEDILPNKLCNDILNEYKNSNEWQVGLVDDDKLNKKVRNCATIEMSFNEVINKNKNVRQKLDAEVFECVKKSIEKYNEKFKQTRISKDSGYQLLKYEKGGFYTQHIDSITEVPRTISCSFTLNDNFKGGEFSFFNNTLVYSLKKGSAIMFPSNFLYPHSVLPVIHGTRYSIVTWFI